MLVEEIIAHFVARQTVKLWHQRNVKSRLGVCMAKPCVENKTKNVLAGHSACRNITTALAELILYLKNTYSCSAGKQEIHLHGNDIGNKGLHSFLCQVGEPPGIKQTFEKCTKTCIFRIFQAVFVCSNKTKKCVTGIKICEKKYLNKTVQYTYPCIQYP